MQKIDFSFTSTDGVVIQAIKWLKGDSVDLKGAVQIAHGMAEHIERYGDFAQALTNAGYIVYGNDHRGHGRTAGSCENVGYFADSDGWDHVVEDMYQLTEIIKAENQNLPVFIFGHSMGSFLTRSYIHQYGDLINGVILSGTGGKPGLLGNAALLVVKREIKRNGRRARSKRMDRLSFGSFNKAFAPNRTAFDWLSRDKAQVDQYIADPYCGEVFTAGFFHDMLNGLIALNKKVNTAKIPKALPIYFISGEKDPVGNNTKGVLATYQAFRDAGIKDVSYKFYPDARHEILNEINKQEVFTDVVTWLNDHS